MKTPDPTGQAMLLGLFAVGIFAMVLGAIVEVGSVAIVGAVLTFTSLIAGRVLLSRAGRAPLAPMSEADVQRYAALLDLPADLIRLGPAPAARPTPTPPVDVHVEMHARRVVAATEAAEGMGHDPAITLAQVAKALNASPEVYDAAVELARKRRKPAASYRLPADEAADRRAEGYTRAYWNNR